MRRSKSCSCSQPPRLMHRAYSIPLSKRSEVQPPPRSIRTVILSTRSLGATEGDPGQNVSHSGASRSLSDPPRSDRLGLWRCPWYVVPAQDVHRDTKEAGGSCPLTRCRNFTLTGCEGWI